MGDHVPFRVEDRKQDQAETTDYRTKNCEDREYFLPLAHIRREPE